MQTTFRCRVANPANLPYLIIDPTDHDQWLAERQKGIGSSEAGTIYGVNAMDTPLKLWRRKTHLDPPTETTEVMQMGHDLEPAVAEWFARDTGAIIDPWSAHDWIARDKNHPWRQVSPDRMFWEKDTPEELQVLENACMLECKTTSHYIGINSTTGEFEYPDYWYCQVQYQMGVLGLKHCYIAYISIFDGRFTHGYFEVVFNEAFFNSLMLQVDRFHNDYVLKNVAPPVNQDIDDAKLRWLVSNVDKSVSCDENTVEAVKTYLANKATIKSIEAENEAIALAIMEQMGDAEALLSPDKQVIVTWKGGSKKKTFDEASFKNDNPTMYEKYVKEVTMGRRFLVKTPKTKEELELDRAKKKKGSVA